MKLIASVLAACAIAGLVYVGLIKEDKYIVYAEFADAGGILKNYNIKIGEVPAGEIKDISLTDDDTVRVRMDLDPDAGPIGAGASAQVRPVNLLGEKYIDLDPGDLSRPQPENVTIPKSRTGVPVEIDDALNVLDPDTRTGLKLIINEFGVAVAGRGADFNQVLEDLPPALDKANEVVGEIAQENRALRRAIDDGDKTLATVVRGKDQFADMVGEAGRALDVAADKRQRLGETIRSAPGALSQLRGTLGELQKATDDLRPAATDLRSATPALADTLDRLPAFAKDAKGTLDAATEVAPDLRKLGRRSTPTLRVLRPTTENLARFSEDAKPILDQLGSPNKAANSTESLMRVMDGWANTTKQRDSLSHVFRIRLTLDEEALTSGLERLPIELGLTKAPATRKKKAADPPKKAPAPAAKPERSEPKLPAVDVKKPVKEVTDKVGETVDKAVTDVTKTVDGVVKGLTDGLGQALAPKKSASEPESGGAQKLLSYLLGS